MATLGPAVFYRQVLVFDVTSFAQSPANLGHKRCGPGGRDAAEEAYHPHRLLLRREGASGRHRTAQQKQELAAPHSMTSSARARIE